MNITFRLAQKEDLETLMLYMEAFHYFDHTQPFDRELATASMEMILLDDKIGRIWLIQHSPEKSSERGPETVGYMVLTLAYRLEYRGYYTFLDELFIREDRRGQGIGTAAIAFLKKACHALGVTKLQLEVKQENSAASKLYIKVGFEPQNREVLVKRFSTR